MESSTRKHVRLYPAIMASLVALGALGSVAIGFVSPAQGYVPGPYLNCVNDSLANLSVLEASLAPANGATAQVGTLVTFTGSSETLPSFAVASSPRLLSSPDIDSGSGFAPPRPSSSGSPQVDTYTFTSTRAAITPGTIYWNASFSDASLNECKGLTPTTYTTATRTLTILPAPMSPPATPLMSPPPAEPLPLQVDVSVTSVFHLSHPAVTYRVHCTASCSGETSYQAFVLRRHAKAVRAFKLDLGPELVSITPPTGGEEQFTHNYAGNSLRMLRTIARTDGILELRITVKVAGASGNVAQGRYEVQLRT